MFACRGPAFVAVSAALRFRSLFAVRLDVGVEWVVFARDLLGAE